VPHNCALSARNLVWRRRPVPHICLSLADVGFHNHVRSERIASALGKKPPEAPSTQGALYSAFTRNRIYDELLTAEVAGSIVNN
jgi:hypothetical protein